jgi:prevent-host-death family protein
VKETVLFLEKEPKNFCLLSGRWIYGHLMAILGSMQEHSVADAKTHLSALIDKALAGEGVVITRHGRPVVALRPLHPPATAVTAAEIDWLATCRAGLAPTLDAGKLLSLMRDDDGR